MFQTTNQIRWLNSVAAYIFSHTPIEIAMDEMGVTEASQSVAGRAQPGAGEKMLI